MQAGLLIPQFQNIASSECLVGPEGESGQGGSLSAQEESSRSADRDFLAILLGMEKDVDLSHADQPVFVDRENKDASTVGHPLDVDKEAKDITVELDSTLVAQEREEATVLPSGLTDEDPSNSNPVVQIFAQTGQKGPVEPANEISNQATLLKQETGRTDTFAVAQEKPVLIIPNAASTPPSKDIAEKPDQTNTAPRFLNQATLKSPVEAANKSNSQDFPLKQAAAKINTEAADQNGLERRAENNLSMSSVKEITENKVAANTTFRVSADPVSKSSIIPGKDISSENTFSKPEQGPFLNPADEMKGHDKETKNIESTPLSKDVQGNASKTNISARGFEQTGEKDDTIHKNAAVKFGSPEGDLSSAKAVRADSDNGGNGLHSSNGQILDKLQFPAMPTKETETVQKNFQTDTLNQIVDKAALSIKKGYSEIKIDLKPEVLGRLRMQISTENHQVLVKMMTEAPLAREIIENNLHQLKAALQNQGLEIDSFEVTVDQDTNQNNGGHKTPSFQITKGEHKEVSDTEHMAAEDTEKPLPLEDKGAGDNHVDYFA